MKFKDCGRFDETFTHIDISGVVTVINASAVNRWARATCLEPVLVQIDPALAAIFRSNGGVSVAKALQVPLSRLECPITLIEWGDGKQTLIDGNHRYVRAHQIGMKLLQAWFVPEHGWRPFIIEEIPPEVFNFLVHDVKETSRANSHS